MRRHWADMLANGRITGRAGPVLRSSFEWTADRKEPIMAEHQSDAESHSVSRWATGGIAFAATVMILIGVFQVTAGLTAIFNDAFYVTTQNYTFGLDVTAWGCESISSSDSSSLSPPLPSSPVAPGRAS